MYYTDVTIESSPQLFELCLKEIKWNQTSLLSPSSTNHLLIIASKQQDQQRRLHDRDHHHHLHIQCMSYTHLMCEHVLFKALACQMDGGRGSHGQSAEGQSPKGLLQL